MLKAHEDLIICDLAETYHIYDYKKMPPQKVALLVLGLKDESRLKLKLSKQSYDLKTIMLVGIFDKLNWLCWAKTKDAAKGVGHPKQIMELIMPREKTSLGFNTGEDFIKARDKIIKSAKGGE